MLEKLVSPRVIAATWGTYAVLTALAYKSTSVAALTPVEAILPTGSPALAWAVAAALLLAGAVLPPTPRCARLGRVTRLSGITIVGALLFMWSASYALDALTEQSRMWVSAKNYVMLACAAAASAYVMGRDHGRRKVVDGDKLV